MRRLTLSRESLTDLTSEELSGVAGGATQPCVTPIVTQALTYQVSLCRVCDLSTVIC